MTVSPTASRTLGRESGVALRRRDFREVQRHLRAAARFVQNRLPCVDMRGGMGWGGVGDLRVCSEAPPD